MFHARYAALKNSPVSLQWVVEGVQSTQRQKKLLVDGRQCEELSSPPLLLNIGFRNGVALYHRDLTEPYKIVRNVISSIIDKDDDDDDEGKHNRST